MSAGLVVREHLREVVYKVLHLHAFSGGSARPVEILVDLVSRFLLLAADTVRVRSELSGRKNANITDAVQAFDELGLDTAELVEWCLSSAFVPAESGDLSGGEDRRVLLDSLRIGIVNDPQDVRVLEVVDTTELLSLSDSENGSNVEDGLLPQTNGVHNDADGDHMVEDDRSMIVSPPSSPLESSLPFHEVPVGTGHDMDLQTGEADTANAHHQLDVNMVHAMPVVTNERREMDYSVLSLPDPEPDNDNIRQSSSAITHPLLLAALQTSGNEDLVNNPARKANPLRIQVANRLAQHALEQYISAPHDSLFTGPYVQPPTLRNLAPAPVHALAMDPTLPTVLLPSFANAQLSISKEFGSVTNEHLSYLVKQVGKQGVPEKLSTLMPPAALTVDGKPQIYGLASPAPWNQRQTSASATATGQKPSVLTDAYLFPTWHTKLKQADQDFEHLKAEQNMG